MQLCAPTAQVHNNHMGMDVTIFARAYSWLGQVGVPCLCVIVVSCAALGAIFFKPVGLGALCSSAGKIMHILCRTGSMFKAQSP